MYLFVSFVRCKQINLIKQIKYMFIYQTTKILFVLSLFIGSINMAISQGNDVKFYEESLDNGLTVIYHIDNSAPVISTVLHYKVGSKDEDMNYTGYAHFFEHLMFEATTDIERAMIPKYVNEAGGNLNAHTSFDETVYQFKLPKNEIKLPLWIESQRMRGLQIEEVGVKTQKGVVLEEKKNRYDNSPYGTMLEKMVSNLFKGGVYSWTTIGSAEHISKATIDNFKVFYDSYYRPNNAVLVIAGDFDIAEVKPYVEQYFGSIPKKEIVRENHPLSELKKEYREKVIDEKIPHDAVFVGFRGPKLGSEDYYAVNLLSNILAMGESSRLYQKLVDKEQVAVQSSLIPLSLEKSGAILLVGVAKPGNELEDIEEMMYDEIEEIAENGVSDEELEKTKNIVEAGNIQSKRNILQKAMNLAKYKAYYNDASLINKEIDNYLKVTKNDIQAVAKKYLMTNKRVVLNYVKK